MGELVNPSPLKKRISKGEAAGVLHESTAICGTNKMLRMDADGDRIFSHEAFLSSSHILYCNVSS